MEIEIFRAIERLFIVGFAGLSIVLGWHLFKIGAVSPNSGILEGKGFKVTLTKVGPGIFFSLFGTVVLAICLNSQLEKSKTSRAMGEEQVIHFRYFNQDQRSKLRDFTISVNTLEMVNITSSSEYEIQRQAIKRAIQELKNQRDNMATVKFGEQKIKSYLDCERGGGGDCLTMGSNREVYEWLTNTYMQ